MLAPQRNLGVQPNCPIILVGNRSRQKVGFFRFCRSSRRSGALRSRELRRKILRRKSLRQTIGALARNGRPNGSQTSRPCSSWTALDLDCRHFAGSPQIESGAYRHQRQRCRARHPQTAAARQGEHGRQPNARQRDEEEPLAASLRRRLRPHSRSHNAGQPNHLNGNRGPIDKCLEWRLHALARSQIPFQALLPSLILRLRTQRL